MSPEVVRRAAVRERGEEEGAAIEERLRESGSKKQAYSRDQAMTEMAAWIAHILSAMSFIL
jgi:hypothetical protein